MRTILIFIVFVLLFSCELPKDTRQWDEYGNEGSRQYKKVKIVKIADKSVLTDAGICFMFDITTFGDSDSPVIGGNANVSIGQSLKLVLHRPNCGLDREIFIIPPGYIVETEDYWSKIVRGGK